MILLAIGALIYFGHPYIAGVLILAMFLDF